MTQCKKKMITVIAFCISFLLGSLGISHAQTKNSGDTVNEKETTEQQITNKVQEETTTAKKKKKSRKKGQSRKRKGTKKKQAKKIESSTAKPEQGKEATEEATEK